VRKQNLFELTAEIRKNIGELQKDFKFLQNAFDANYLQIEIFLERAEMILQHPAANALRPRLLKLI
jgi:hypothetical protein